MVDTVLVAVLAHIFVKATLVVGGAWIVARLLARSSAAKRHGVWSVAMALLLLMPVVAPLLPTWNAGFIPDMASGDARPAGIEAASHSSANESPIRQVGNARSGETAAPAASSGAETSRVAAEEGSTAPLGVGLSWSDGVLWIWGLGAAWMLVQVMLGLAWVMRRERRAVALQDPAHLGMVRRLTRELGARRSVRVAFAPEVQTPMVWGLLRPTILLPAEARSWPEQRFRAVLLHELAHVKRWDYPAHLLTQCVQALFWPNPLVWLAARRARQEQEQASDDVVLAAGMASHEYADHLLDIIRSLRDQGSRRMEGAVAMGRQSSIKERMRALLSDQVDRSPLSLRTGLAMSLVGGLLALPVIALSLGASASADSSGGFSYVGIQAEDGNLARDTQIRGEVSSGDRYVEATGTTENMETPPGVSSSIYTFQVPREGTYMIWGRVFSPNSGSNSLWVRMDEGRWIRWNEIGETGQWRWDEVHDSDQNEELVGFELGKGEHTLQIARRETGVRLDKMIITSNWNYRPEGLQPAPPNEEAERVWLEAEEGWLQAPMKVQSDRHAAGWQYVESDETDSREEAPSGGRALYDFDVSAAGPFYVWGRVLAKDDEHDSFWMRMDEGKWIRWNNLEAGRTWSWQRLHDSDSDGRVVHFELEEGRHTLEVAYREEDAKLDKLLVVGGGSYLPRGQGTASGQTPYRHRLEPEAGRLQPPTQAARDTFASGGAFVAVPDGESNDAPEGGPGYAEMHFSVPETGQYVVYGRVRAPNSNDNSFYVSIDGGEEVAWHAPGPSSEDTAAGWTWDLVSSGEGDDITDPYVFTLEEGEHVLRIRNREDGTELDEVVVTNEAGLQGGAAITVTGI